MVRLATKPAHKPQLHQRARKGNVGHDPNCDIRHRVVQTTLDLLNTKVDIIYFRDFLRGDSSSVSLRLFLSFLCFSLDLCFSFRSEWRDGARSVSYCLRIAATWRLTSGVCAMAVSG